MPLSRVANESDLAEGRLLSVKTPSGTRVCLVRVDAAVYALKDECTHAEYPLSEGSLEGECQLECALHGAVFDVRDGSVLGPPAMEPVQTFPVKIEDGGIWIEE
jgi:3-phenylpropionate/trans-cinnamate dioxygenase ferredoxin subunit